jgi:serine/threonine-protein kinase
MSDFTLLAEHVDAARALGGDARRTYVDSLPPELARQVRDLLQFEHATLDLSQIPAIELALDVLADPVPERIGRWRVLELIGRGGMASVYRVERSEGAIRQLAACKIGYARDDLEDGLRRETATLLDLSHPGIAHVLDFGHTVGGRPWLVSEFIEGADILAFANARRLPLTARLALFEDVLSAVAHAHERLLLHQDIKPGNILVDSAGRPRLIDFGLATVLSGGGDSPVLGYTPRYASPEQVRGERLTVRSDIYSLGITLATLLEGAARARGHDDAQAIIARATREDLVQRYPSVSDMAADVRAIRQSRPVAARAGGAGYRFARFLQRHPLPVALAALIVLSIGIGVAATLWQARQAIAAGERAEIERQRATATATFLTRLFRSASPSHEGRTETRLTEFLAPAFEQLKNDDALTPGARIDIARTLAAAYAGIGQSEQAIEAYDYGIQQARRNQDARTEAEILISLARMYGANLQIEASMQTLDRAIAASVDDPELRDKARHARVNIVFASEDWPGVLSLSEELIRDADAGSAFLALQRAGLEYSRATALMRLGRLDEAEAAAQRAQSEYGKRFGEHSGSVSDVLDTRMQIAMAQGDLERAETRAEELREMAAHVYGTSHLRYGEVLNNIAMLRQHQGRSTDAADAYRQAYDILQAAGAAETPRAATVRQNLGSALVTIGDIEAGLAHLRGADATLTATLGEHHVMTLKGKGQIAGALGLSGDWHAALELYEELDADFARVAPISFYRADFLLSHASVLADAGRYEQCAARVAHATDAAREVVGAGHWFLDLYAAYGAYCEARLGNAGAAERLAALVDSLVTKLPAESNDLETVRELLTRLKDQ